MIKAYASYFVSYLLTRLKEVDNIFQIVLFGSVAKDEATKESDVDIFIVLKRKNKKLKEKIEKILDEFYSSREALIFKVKSIDNKINLIIDRLEDWPDIKLSIESTGIILYGKYIPIGIKGNKYVIIFWEGIEKNRGAFLNKIYGVKVKNKKYAGLLEKFNGRKLGKSSIMVPVQYREDILKTLKHYNANARIIEVYM